MTGFANASVNRYTGLIQIEGVGANGQPIHAQVSRWTALELSKQLEMEALRAILAPLVDDREPFDASLEREPVEHTS